MTIFSCLNLTAQDVVLKGNEAFIARQKLYCRNSEEEKTRYGSGKVELTADFLERDKHLFNVIGINTSLCDVEEKEQRGKKFRSASREIMKCLDPETNEVMDVWENP